MVDWISKIEDEERTLEQAELARQRAERERMDAKIASFQVVKNKICPHLEARIAEVQQRLRIDLRLDLAETALTVSSPKRIGSRRRASHPYRFEISDFDPDSYTVRVRVFVDKRIYREGRRPEGITEGDFYGRDEIVADVRSDLDQLATSGLQLLLEWLVRAHREGGTPDALQIVAVSQANNSEQVKQPRAAWVLGRTRSLRDPLRFLRWIATLTLGD